MNESHCSSSSLSDDSIVKGKNTSGKKESMPTETLLDLFQKSKKRLAKAGTTIFVPKRFLLGCELWPLQKEKISQSQN